MAKISGKFPVSFLQATYLPCWRSQIYGAKRNTIGSCAVTWKFRSVQWTCEVRTGNRGAIHSTKIPTGPTEKRGPPQKVDPFFRNFSGWAEPIHWVLAGALFGPKFPESLVEWIAPRVYGWVYDLFANVLSRFACELGLFTLSDNNIS